MAPAHIPLAAGKLFLVMADTPAMHRQRSSRQRRHSSPNQAVDQALRRRIELESLVVAISTRMLAALPETADAEIVAALGEMGSFSGAERSFLNQIAGDPPLASNTHEYCRGQLTSLREVVQGIPLSNYPWSFDQLQHGKAVWIHRDNMPPEAAAELQWLQRFDLASSLVVPLMVQGRLAGALGFNTKSREKGWGDEDLDCLRMAGEIFLQALARQRAELEQQKLKDQLLRMARMESIGRLAGGVAHDFNNLLQVISGNLQLMADDIADNPRAQRRVDNAMAGVTRGSKLASQLLSFGRRQPLAPRVLNAARLIRNMDDLLRRSLGEEVELETIISGGLWNTLIDAGNLENALLNLAINARDAMNGRGKLTIEAGNAWLDESYVQGHPDAKVGQYVLVAVSDNGCGMPAELLEKAFEPFYTTKSEGRGTGLGLSMVYGFVKQSGGHVKIYSEVGVGTTVKLYLPRSTKSEETAPVSDTGPVLGGNETILVAEDEDFVRETVVALLSNLGYRVLQARDGQRAVSIIESGIGIDLLFTDVVMPGNIRSTELAKRAVQALPDIAVLFTSGYTQNGIVHGGQLDEGVELLSKPYTTEALARKVRSVLSAQQAKNAATRTAPSSSGPELPVISPRPDAVEPRSLRILLCEDDEQIRMTVTEMLVAKGHQVAGTHRADHAVQLFEAQPFDVLVTDVALPDGSGVELVRTLRERVPELPVLFATGRVTDDEIPASVRTSTLTKPYGADALLAALALLTA